MPRRQVLVTGIDGQRNEFLADVRGRVVCLFRRDGVGGRDDESRAAPDMAVDAEVDPRTADGACFLQARLNVSLPGVGREVADALARTAHETCPYPKATPGNIDVVISVI